MNTDKAQQYFGDLVHDLRARGLLPVVILLAVGLVAAPMLIKGGGEDVPPPPPAEVPGTGEAALQNEPAVLTYNPSVRDYKERLSDLQQKDPFIQQFREPAATEAAEETAGASVSPTEDTGSSGGSTGTTGGSPEGSTGGSSQTVNRLFYYRETDISLGVAGGKQKRRNRVPDLSFLPSDKNPLLVYMGATRNAKTAVFLVSDEVVVTDGQDRCSPSPQECGGLRMREGDAVTLYDGVSGRSYRLKVLDIRLIVSEKLPERG